MTFAFTAWDYEVTYLELAAVLVALVAGGLAIKGTLRIRVLGSIALIVGWVLLSPLLQALGGVATWLDALIFDGSLAGQVLMAVVGWRQCIRMGSTTPAPELRSAPA